MPPFYNLILNSNAGGPIMKDEISKTWWLNRRLWRLTLLVLLGVVTFATIEHPGQSWGAESKPRIIPEPSPERVGQNFLAGRPLAYFTLPNFVGSSQCALCHTDLKDSQGNDMSITNHWRSTMMANAAKDPLWQAKVASEVARNPAIKDVIEKKCVVCHMPMSWTQQSVSGKDYPAEGEGVFAGFLRGTSQLNSAAMDGVSCSLCHQIVDKDLGIKTSFSGKFIIDTKTQPPNRLIFGPYHDPIRETMQTSFGFDPAFGPQINDSALCATCHTLFTPYLDASGKVAGEFPEQTAYLEWLQSSYAEQPGKRHEIGETSVNIRLCQECHMPHSPAGGVIIAKYAPLAVQPKDHFSQHHFVGGNVFMLNVLADQSSKLAVSASTAEIEATRDRTLRQLQNNTANILISPVSLKGDTVTATVRVENLTGHKFPTGFPTRRAWIYFVVLDKSENIVFESGKPLADGSISGNDADQDTATFETHFERVTQPDQVQIYEAVMHDTDNRVTHTLLRGAGYAKDNRLLPKGFEKSKASQDIAVHGQALEDQNFIGGSDDVIYQIKIEKGQGPYTVEARLYYSPITLSFMKDLAKDDDLALVKRFVGFYNKADKAPVLVATAQATVK